VSDTQNGNGAKPKRDWLAIRHEYEHGTISQRALAAKHAISEDTVFQRAMREKWIQRARLVRKSALDIEAKLKETVEARVRDELAPYIEKEKERFTRAGLKLAKLGMKRSERYFKTNRVVEAKSEANIAKAFSTYHREGRLALGMSDGAGVGGTYSVNVLANHAMIQAAPSQSQD
jgi:hypothetical protein